MIQPIEPFRAAGPLEESRDVFIADVASTFAGTQQPRDAAGDMLLRWRIAGYSKAQILAALSSPELAAALSAGQREAVARGVAWLGPWLQEEHPHVPSHWDY